MTTSISISLDNLASDLNRDSFKQYHCAMSSNRLAIALNHHMMISSIIGEIDPEDGIPFAPQMDSMVPFNEGYDRVSALQWLSDDLLGVGFDSGIICCYSASGEYLFEQKFHESSVQSIKITDRPVNSSVFGGSCVYILFEDGHLVVVTLASLRGIPALLASTDQSTRGRRGAPNPKGKEGNLVSQLKFRLSEEDVTTSFLVVPSNISTNCPPVLTIQAGEMHFDSILTGGFNSTLSYHHLMATQPAVSMGKLISHIKSKVTKAVSQTVNNAFSSFFGIGSSSSGGTVSDHSSGSAPISKVKVDKKEAVASYRFNDSKRRILRLSIDPTNKLIATADTLGRVMLFDCRVHCMVRLWKGVRDARFAWTVGYTTKQKQASAGGSNKIDVTMAGTGIRRQLRSHKSLSLAIYAPQLGLLSLWAMRHGPCIRTIAVGFQTQIFTIYDVCSVTGASTAKCAVMKVVEDVNATESNGSTVADSGSSGGNISIEISTVSPQEGGDEQHDILLSELLLERERAQRERRLSQGSADDEYQVGMNGGLGGDDENDDDVLLQLRELLNSAQGGSDVGRRGSGSGFGGPGSVGSGGGGPRLSLINGVKPVKLSDLDLAPTTCSVATAAESAAKVKAQEQGFSVLKDVDPRQREDKIYKMIRRLLESSTSSNSSNNSNSSNSGGVSRVGSRCVSGANTPNTRNNMNMGMMGHYSSPPMSRDNSAFAPNGDTNGGEGVSAAAVEADVWVGLSHITSVDVLSACIECIDAAERGRSGPEYAYSSRQQQAPLDNSRFTMQFHSDICDLMIDVGKKQNNAKFVLVGIMRRRLLKAYLLLLKFSQNVDNTVFSLGEKRGVSQVSQRTPVAVTNEVTQLVKQNTHRAEAFCWLSRMHTKLVMQQQSQNGMGRDSMDSSNAQQYRQSSADSDIPPAPTRVSSPGYPPTHVSSPGATRTSSTSSLMTYFSPVSSPMASPSVSTNNIKTVGGAGLGNRASSSRASVGGGSGMLSSLTFAMFLAFHKLVWHRIPAGGMGVSGQQEDEEGCCSIRFRGQELLSLLQGPAGQAFKPVYHKQSQLLTPEQQQQKKYGGSGSAAVGAGSGSANRLSTNNLAPTSSQALHGVGAGGNFGLAGTGTGNKHLSFKNTTPISSSVNNNIHSPASRTGTPVPTGAGGSHSSRSTPSHSIGQYQQQHVDPWRCDPIALFPLAVPSARNHSDGVGADTSTGSDCPHPQQQQQQQQQASHFNFNSHQSHHLQQQQQQQLWAPSAWMLFELLSLLLSPLVMQVDVFALQDYDSGVLSAMGLSSGFGLRRFLPLLTGYMEHVLSPLQSVTAVMNILLYKQQISTAPLQRWLRDVLLSFQSALRVDMEEEEGIQEELKARVQNMITRQAPEEDLIEDVNDHYQLIVTRTLFIRDLVASGGCLGSNSCAPSRGAPPPPTPPVTASAVSSAVSSFSRNFPFGGNKQQQQQQDSHYGNISKRPTDPSPIFSYDDSIRFALRPMWLALRSSHFCEAATEVMMSLCAVIIEIMTAVGEQLERRTYGVDNLWHTILSWEILFKQSRVAVLLSSRLGTNNLLTGAATTATGSRLGTGIGVGSMRGFGMNLSTHYHTQPTGDTDITKNNNNNNSIGGGGGGGGVGTVSVSVNVMALSHGDVSIYRLLAEDTLCFTTNADQAREHEARCNDVYLKRVISNSKTFGPTGSISGSSGGGGGLGVSAGLLMAWGLGANQRWRELLSLVEAEDAENEAAVAVQQQALWLAKAQAQGQVHGQGQSGESGSGDGNFSGDDNINSSGNNNHSNRSGSTSQNRPVRRRKPLLLLFPLHNQAEPLGAYRGLILAERWAETPVNVELLTSAVSHLYPLPPSTRSAVAEHICDRLLNPFIKSYLLLEEVSAHPGSNNNSTGISPNGPVASLHHSSKNAAATGAGAAYKSPSRNHGPSMHIDTTAGGDCHTHTHHEVLPEIPREFLQRVRSGAAAYNSNTKQQQSTATGSTDMLREFIQAALDMLSFVVDTTHSSSNSSNNNSNNNSRSSGNYPDAPPIAIAAAAYASPSAALRKTPNTPTQSFDDFYSYSYNNGHGNSNGSTSAPYVNERDIGNAAVTAAVGLEYQEERNNLPGIGEAATTTEINNSVWPAFSDPQLVGLVDRLNRMKGGHDSAVKTHCSVLLVILLRNLCNLRRIKPSELFTGSPPLLEYICAPGSLTKAYHKEFLFHAAGQPPEYSTGGSISSSSSGSSSSGGDGGVGHIEHVRSGSDVATFLADSTTTITPAAATGVALAATKLYRIRMEFLYQCFMCLQYHYTTAVYRLAELWYGSAPVQLDAVKILHIKALLEGRNDDIVEEVASQVSNVGAVVDCITTGLRVRLGLCISRIDRIPAYGMLIISMDAAAVAWARSVVTIPPDPLIVNRIASGKQNPVDFDIASTKHLVTRTHGLLLAIPTAVRDHNWSKRKNKCDILISLCTSLESSFSIHQ